MSIEQTEDEQTIASKEEAQSLCANLSNITNELISLLDEETSLLRKAKIKDISPLHIRKDALAAALTHHMGRFRANANIIRELTPEGLDALQRERNQFQKSIEANHNALMAMQAVSERILQTVSEKVSKKQGGPEVYTPAGNIANAGIKRTAAISIDTAL